MYWAPLETRDSPSLEGSRTLTPQEIEELLQIMKNLAAEGKSILFITHKLNEIMAVADRCSVLRKGKYNCNQPLPSFK